MSSLRKKYMQEIGQPEPIGLGDLIAGLTRITGISALVKRREARTGKTCGCEERREKLNKIKLMS